MNATHTDHVPGAETAVYRTDLPLPGRREGKVRDIYPLPGEPGGPPRLLIVATDRVSAFDVVLPTPVPGKGRLLTEISTRWFERIRSMNIIGDHLLSTDSRDVPGIDQQQQGQLEGRIMVGRAARVIPIEFVVRGYLAGSGWVEYQKSGAVCGVPLPPGLKRCERLPEPIFTPATKAETGHDENIDFQRASAIAGEDVMQRLRQVSIDIYRQGTEHARSRGIILADTKFEFGYALDAEGKETDEIILIDEVLTPDSSRFWPAEEYKPGREPQSFDKQYVRNHLLELVNTGKWDKSPPGPELPGEIVRNTLARYEEALTRLFG